MIARWQATLVLVWALCLFAWPLWLAGAGRPLAAAGWFVAWLLWHPIWLGLGMLQARAHHGADPAPRASLAQWWQAWRGEVVVAARVFGWWQPFQAQRWPDQLSGRPGQAGVLLVHGFVCNRGLWNAWLPWLRANDIPHVALSLEPVLGNIDDYLPQIEAAVCRLEAATGRAPLLLAHSMGGLAARAWWSMPGNAGRLRGLITLGSPHQGTALARWAVSENGRQMRLDSDWLQALAARESEDQRARTCCVYSHTDHVVYPPSTACLPGARAVHLAATAHVALVAHPRARQLVQAALNEP